MKASSDATYTAKLGLNHEDPPSSNLIQPQTSTMNNSSSLLKPIPIHTMNPTLSYNDLDDEKEVFKSSRSSPNANVNQAQFVFSGNKQPQYTSGKPSVLSDGTPKGQPIPQSPFVPIPLQNLSTSTMDSQPSIPGQPQTSYHGHSSTQQQDGGFRPTAQQSSVLAASTPAAFITPSIPAGTGATGTRSLFTQSLTQLSIPPALSQIGTPKSQSSLPTPIMTPVHSTGGESTNAMFSSPHLAFPLSHNRQTNGGSGIPHGVVPRGTYVASMLSIAKNSHNTPCNATMASRLNAMQFTVYHAFLMSGKVVNYLQPRPVVMPIDKALLSRPIKRHRPNSAVSENNTAGNTGKPDLSRSLSSDKHSTRQSSTMKDNDDEDKPSPLSFLTAASLATIPEHTTLPHEKDDIDYSAPLVRTTKWYEQFLTQPQLMWVLRPDKGSHHPPP